MNYLNTMILCDFYKLSHRPMYPKNTTYIHATWTPRESRVAGVNEVVALGFQKFNKKYLIDFFNENFFKRDKADVVKDFTRFIKFTLGDQNPETKHIEELHDLGYLPLLIKAVPEGTLVPLRCPMMTIENTDPRFFWLTNFIETLASCELWKASTSATLALQYKKVLIDYAKQTGGSLDFIPFQGHDFSMRGMSSLESAINSGIGHLMSFVGTDTCPAISALEEYYGADIEKELVGTSLPATEHSIQCSYGDDLAYIRCLINEVHPKGFVSIVSDGYDLWDVIGRVLPLLKDEIMARDGKVVIRPDSGDPVKIVCGDPNGRTELERKGVIEALYDLFGGTVNAKGFKELDSHIGCIYGDAITVDRCEEICKQLRDKGFASTNMVYGIGSFTYQYNTRDTFGFALKSTNAIINGVEIKLFKDPKTDSGVKKSQKGMVLVTQDDTNGIAWTDNLTIADLAVFSNLNLLHPIFKDGVIMNFQKCSEMRKRVARDQ